MKYRYVTQVIFRNNSGVTIQCIDKREAESNVTHYINERLKDAATITFSSLSNCANVFLMNEIIAITVTDLQVMLDVHKQDLIIHKRMESEIEFSSSEDD